MNELSVFMDTCFEDIAKSKQIISKEKQLEQHANDTEMYINFDTFS